MWKDVIGHLSQIEMLKSHIASGQMDHAYLFAGIKGLGKTLVAVEFFKAINCLKTPGDPCDACPSCIKALSGNHPDLVKIGLKSRSWIKVEDVRNALEGIALRPFEARFRVVIIEPAELMNQASSNAILKTLEEPPDTTIFILIAHKPSLLLPTIISRCQRIRFTPIDPKAIYEMTQSKIDPFVVSLSSGAIGAMASSDADFILECRKEIMSLFKGYSPFSLASNLASSAKANRDLTPIMISTIESVIRDIIVMKDGGDNIINKDLYGIPFRHITSYDISQILDCIHEVRCGVNDNINLKVALSELFLMLARIISP